MEIRIASADPEDAMLAHQNGGARVVDEVAGEPWKLVDDFVCDVGVAFGRDKHSESGRGEQRGHERPGAWGAMAFSRPADGSSPA